MSKYAIINLDILEEKIEEAYRNRSANITGLIFVKTLLEPIKNDSTTYTEEEARELILSGIIKWNSITPRTMEALSEQFETWFAQNKKNNK